MLSGCSKKTIGIGLAISAVIITILVIIGITHSNSSASGSSNTDEIAGTWKNTQSSARINEITFYTDGTCQMSNDNALFDWAIVNENMLKLSAYTTVYVWEFDLSGNTLTLTADGYTATFEKVGSSNKDEIVGTKTENNDEDPPELVPDALTDDDFGPKCSVCGDPFNEITKEYNDTGVCESCAKIVYK